MNKEINLTIREVGNTKHRYDYVHMYHVLSKCNGVNYACAWSDFCFTLKK